jgi:hypothetical protein
MVWPSLLRDQLRERARTWAERQGVPAYESLGNPATVLFQKSLRGEFHGSFFKETWAVIKANSDWSLRLGKPHSQRDALPVEYQTSAMELDSSNSSDALLMNCFSYPGASVRFASVLGALLLTRFHNLGTRHGSSSPTEAKTELKWIWSLATPS